MTLKEAIEKSTEGREQNLPVRRKAWTHAGTLIVRRTGGYMKGQLEDCHTGDTADLFFVDDLCGTDWEVVGG